MIRKFIAAALAARRDPDEPLVLGEEARGISRRQLLLGLAAVPIAAHALPKIWVPGERTISIPPRTIEPITLADFFVPEFDFEDLCVNQDTYTYELMGQAGYPVRVARSAVRLSAIGTLDGTQARALMRGLVTEDFDQHGYAFSYVPSAAFVRIKGPVFRDVIWDVESVTAHPFYGGSGGIGGGGLTYKYVVKMCAVHT